MKLSSAAKSPSLADRADMLDLECQNLYRKYYGSVHSTKKLKVFPDDGKLITFTSNTSFGLLRKIILFKRIIFGGKFKVVKPTRGNKRLGNKFLYYDIFNYFQFLQGLDIALPKNMLSKKACEHGLLDILKKHKRIPLELLHKRTFNSRERERIRKSNESIFARVIQYL